MQEQFLSKRLTERESQQALRQLRLPSAQIDFCSNDYLGIAKHNLLSGTSFNNSIEALKHGSTGSRLLSGNYRLIETVEEEIAAFHQAPAGLLFNSGYDANLGLLSCIAGRNDTIIYDYLSHASIRDGIKLSLAKSFSFRHNDLSDLEKKMKVATGQIFVVTESVFSMDGDSAPLIDMSTLCDRYNAALIVDEAHATGVIGGKGEGLVQALALQDRVFARVHTFGKACGAHGAIILGSKKLKDYLINFSRAFIYTTALPASAIVAIRNAYQVFPTMNKERIALNKLVSRFQSTPVAYAKVKSETAVQGIIIPGNEVVKKCALLLQEKDLDVRPILYPTVPKGEERLRIVMHAFNTDDELTLLVKILNEAQLT